MMDKIREVALKTLYKINNENAYSNIALNEMLKNQKLDKRDIGFISEIVYGTTTWLLTIDEIIKKHSNLKLKKISPWILNILRMGVYQIVFLDKVPKSAAVNESVNLAKKYGHASSSKFVNAILRKVEKKDYEELFNIEDKIEKISKTTSMPVWIIEELNKELEIEEIEKICTNFNNRPKVSIRVNTLKISIDELKEKLSEQNIKFTEGILKDFLILEEIKEIENLELFKNGYFTIQDESAGLPCIVLDPEKGEKILDACSAPGGKTTYMAQLMQNQGTIEAWDIYEHRLKLVEDTANRLGINIIKTRTKNSEKFDKENLEKFDKILLDVPCMGIGVIKRKPDIKWKRKKEDIKEITDIQYEILNTCSKYLKPKGEIVYSTCSILEEENEKVIEKFLKENLDFEIKKNEIKNIPSFSEYVENDKFLKIYPNKELDGFFICKLAKK